MKPANFPARKDARRRGALSRLGTSPKTKLTAAQIAEGSALLMSLLNPGARSERTKKVRGIGGRRLAGVA